MRWVLSPGIALCLVLAACSGGGDPSLDGEWLAEEPATVLAASADAMVGTESVAFTLERTGAAVHIDPLETLTLDAVTGRFTVPADAEAIVTVQVNDSLRTELGAVATGGEVWLSNPVTGVFEPLPDGYDIDPRLFFDPVNGWQPLIDGLQHAEFVGVENDRYHLRGLATADRIAAVTAGLAAEDIVVDLWVHPVDATVRRVAFTTSTADGAASWLLELDDYGEPFVISPPEVAA
ncbi:MAG: LppX_LprAFG lipoprotein [Actinomycetota bacterium]